MPNIYLKSINFDNIAFRKLKNIHIEFAKRVTLIAGHNGIGKSTILALVSNGSGYSSSTPRSYFNRGFQGNLNDIIHLDYNKEFIELRDEGSYLPSPVLEYQIDNQVLRKRSSLTERRDRNEIRVVPRNDPHRPFEVDGMILCGPDAKVPLPTIYLGMTRMLPVGESTPSWIENTTDNDIHDEDAIFIHNFVNAVIKRGIPGEDRNPIITTQTIKHTRKTAKHPSYPYSSKCVSLGQDSLSSIATALASFKKLKRESDDYPGGLLVIDELDAGFHPHAQTALMDQLKREAKRLDLQIIATTHSLNLIEAVHSETNPVGPGGQRRDAVVYLTDNQRPRVANYSLEQIKNDMSLTPPSRPIKSKDTIKIYLEDSEAEYFLSRMLNRGLKISIKRQTGAGLKPIAVHIGCNQLVALGKHDPHFDKVLIVVDADTHVQRRSPNPGNIVKLPGEVGERERLSPEATLYRFIERMVEDQEQYPTAYARLVELGLNTNYLLEYFLDGDTNINERVSAKRWFKNRIDLIKQWELVDLWMMEHPKNVSDFINRFEQAALKVSK